MMVYNMADFSIVKCQRCGQEGHAKKACPQLRSKKLAKIRCFNCGETGHIAKDCSGRAQKWEKSNTTVIGVDSISHEPKIGKVKEDCEVATEPCVIRDSQKYGTKEAEVDVVPTDSSVNMYGARNQVNTPWSLAQPTTIASSNQQLASGNTMQISTITSPTINHHTSNPPTNVDAQYRTDYPPIKCYNCGEDSHMRRECPSLVNGPQLKCFTCGRQGHVSRDCPESMTGGFRPIFVTSNSVSEEDIIPFIDSHCHMDYLLERYRYDIKDLAKFQRDFGYPGNYKACITSFCDPAAYSSLSITEELLTYDHIWAAFGFHPHNAKHYNIEYEGKLVEYLSHPKCLALGEIGLDFSVRCQSDAEIQREAFIRQVNLAIAFNKPLVIHCRDAETQVFDVLISTIPRIWRIHLHCYTGSLGDAQNFLDYFPNACLGISGVVTFSSATQVHDVVRNTPMERLVLETDSPYLVPSNMGKIVKWNHPGLLPYVAKEVAAIKGIDIKVVMEHALANTKRLYGI